MTLDITIDGSGEVGHVASWSVRESATQHSLAQSSGSVGSLDITAAAVVSGKSAYLNDCGISVSDGTGAWAGRIMDAPTSGAAVTVKAEGALRFLNAVRTAPPAGRFVLPVTAVGGEGSGDGQFLYPGDVVFDSNGNMFVADRGNFRIQKFAPDGDGGWAYAAQVGSSGSGNGQFGGPGGAQPSAGWLAVDSLDNIYATDPFNSRVQKFTNALAYVAQVGSFGSGNGQFGLSTGIAIDGSDNVYVHDFIERRIQRFNTSLAYQSQFAIPGNGNGLDWDAVTGDLFITQFQDVSSVSYNNVRRYSTGGVYSGNATPGGLGVDDGYFAVDAANPTTTQTPQDVAVLSDGTVVVTDRFAARVQFFDSTLAFIGKFGSYGSGAGEFKNPRGLGVDADDNIYVSDHGNHRIQVFSRASLVNTTPLSEVIESYIRLCDPDSDHAYSYDCASDPEVAFPGWTDVVWRKLNELCAVYNIEIYYQAGTVHVGDIGARELDISNATVATRTPESIQPARSVQVVNQNIVAGDGLTMYDAADANTIHTVDVGAVRVITLATNNHPASLNYPTPIDAAPIGAGQYCVQDSTGAAIDAADWTAAGGNVTVAVGEATGTIVLTITGPTATIAGTTAPYSLASGTGTSRVATLSITGSGVTTNPQIVTVATGADPTRIKQEVARTIDVPFIGTLGQAYDAGVWAACDSLFGLTLKFRIPRESSKTFGDYAGRKFTWGNARWRVMDATIDVGGVDITARWHTTVGEFDDAWAGDTVGDLDAEWANYLARDVTVTPLATDLP